VSKRLADCAPDHVTHLIDENRSLFNLRAGRIGGSSVYESEAISWVTTPGSAWPNSAFRPRLTEDNAGHVIDFWRTQAAAGLAPRRIVFAGSEPLERLLARCGLKRTASNAAMYADLSRIADPLGDSRSFRIVRVRDGAAFAEWVSVLGPAMFGRPVSRDAFAKIVSADDLRLFLGYAEGAPAATSLLFCSDGVASIHLVSTLEQFRGRGLGTMLTHAAAMAARDLGFEDVTLFASAMGESIYRRMGFVECGRIAIYSLE